MLQKIYYLLNNYKHFNIIERNLKNFVLDINTIHTSVCTTHAYIIYMANIIYVNLFCNSKKCMYQAFIIRVMILYELYKKHTCLRL